VGINGSEGRKLMKRSLLGLVGLLGLVAVIATSGCGDSGPSAGEVSASCNAYCDAYGAAACADPIYTDAAECKSTECVDTSSGSEGCRTAVKNYYDCEKSQADICADTGCGNQALSILTSCGG
jgi:hypothetical protein